MIPLSGNEPIRSQSVKIGKGSKERKDKTSGAFFETNVSKNFESTKKINGKIETSSEKTNKVDQLGEKEIIGVKENKRKDCPSSTIVF